MNKAETRAEHIVSRATADAASRLTEGAGQAKDYATKMNNYMI